MKELVIEFLKSKKLEFTATTIAVTTAITVEIPNALYWRTVTNKIEPRKFYLNVTDDNVQFENKLFSKDEFDDFKKEINEHIESLIADSTENIKLMLRTETIMKYADNLKKTKTDYHKLQVFDFHSTELHYIELVMLNEDEEVERKYVDVTKLETSKFPLKLDYDFFGKVTLVGTTSKDIRITSVNTIIEYVEDISDTTEDKFDLEIYLQ